MIGANGASDPGERPDPSIGPEAVAEAARRIVAGSLVAFPTETVYGLGAAALDADTVGRVFALKGRPATNPLIVHVDSVAMAQTITTTWPEAAARLAAVFWPGPLSLVLPKTDDVPDVVTAGGPTVAVRAPRHPLTLALIAAAGTPIVGPSANRSGAVSPTTAAHVRSEFPDAIASGELFVLDGGPCETGIESTVVDLTGDAPRVLRPGVIGAAAISGALGGTVYTGSAAAPSEGAVASPGLLGPHYQPKARVVLARSSRDVEAAVDSAKEAGAVVLSTPGMPVPLDPPHTLLTMPTAATAYAARLYAALREADAAEPALIVVVLPRPAPISAEDDAIWAAVTDRLIRASARG